MANTILDISTASANVNVFNSSHTANSNTTSFVGVRAVDGYWHGKYYYETTIDFTNSSPFSVATGITSDVTGYNKISTNSFTLYANSGQLWVDATLKANIGIINNGNTVCLAFDFNLGYGWVRQGASGLWNNNASGDPSSNVGGFQIPATAYKTGVFPARPVLSFRDVKFGQGTVNFGDSAFVGAVPAGFTGGWPSGGDPTTVIASDVGIEILTTGNVSNLIVSDMGLEIIGQSNTTNVIATTVGFDIIGQANTVNLIATCVGLEVFATRPGSQSQGNPVQYVLHQEF